jgi:hypothetical protein
LVASEEDAAATTQAILDVVASVRSKGAWSADPEPQQRGLARHLGLESAVLTMQGTVEPAKQAKLARNQCFRSRRHPTLCYRAVTPAIGTAAASSTTGSPAFNDRTSTGTETYSAKPPYPCSRRLA